MTGHLEHGDNVWIGGTVHDGPECPNRLDVSPIEAREPEYICGCRPWELTGEQVAAVIASSSDAEEPVECGFRYDPGQDQAGARTEALASSFWNSPSGDQAPMTLPGHTTPAETLDQDGDIVPGMIATHGPIVVRRHNVVQTAVLLGLGWAAIVAGVIWWIVS